MLLGGASDQIQTLDMIPVLIVQLCVRRTCGSPGMFLITHGGCRIAPITLKKVTRYFAEVYPVHAGTCFYSGAWSQ
jgi:hypothetical protein